MSVAKENTEALHVTDDTRDIVTNRVNEKVLCEEGATRISKNTIGASTIVGSTTNGIVGTNIGTQSGSQQVVGASGRTRTLYSIVNPNNNYNERFYDDTFESVSTTADWGTTPGQLGMTTGEIAQSSSVAYNDGTITRAMISLSLSSGSESDLTVQLSADGGSNWETVTINETHDFTNTGSNLMFKITSAGSVTITLVKVSYT